MKFVEHLAAPEYGSIRPGSPEDIPPGYSPRDYPKPAVSCDVIVTSRIRGRTHVLLIRRGHAPYAGFWAFPGGFLEMHEDLDEAAARELKEETGVDLAAGGVRHFEQLRAFGTPGRDPRDRVITIAYLAVVDGDRVKPEAGDDAADAAWVPFDAALGNREALAFDHPMIIEIVAQRLEELALP